MDNTLFFGDNLDILRTYIPDESVDLVYLDPPFNSNRSYNLLFKDDDKGSSPVPGQVFEDTWTWKGAAKTYDEEILSERTSDNVRRALQAFRQMLGTSPMMAYLTMMTPRLIELHRVLKPSGSLYLHCDPTASHYLKIVLDTIFDPTNFRNEVTWKRRHGFTSAVHESNRFGNCTDTLLFYGKSEATRFRPQYNRETKEYREYIAKSFTLADTDGRLYQATSLTNPAYRPNLIYEYKGYQPPANGWMISKEKMKQWDEEGRIHFPKDPNGRLRRKSYADELRGMPIQNLWDDIQQLGAHDAERLGYPTQKPLPLLRRIINASSAPGDVVLDPFCGCGTAVDAAQELGRRWIGIDIAIQAIGIIEERLHMYHGLVPSLDYVVEGKPQDEAGARKLLERQGRYRFEDWALDYVRAEPWTGKVKRGKDRGRDGVIVFRDSETKTPHRALVQVKSGEDRAPTHVRDLRGTMDREGVEMGVFLTLEPATPEMELEAATAGFYTDQATKSKVPRIQILRIGDLLKGRVRVELPEGSVIISRRIGRKAETLQPAQRVLIPALPLSEPSNVIRVATKPAKERRKRGQTG